MPKFQIGIIWDMFNYYEDDDISNYIFELIVEKLRVYDYCFLNGEEDVVQVFKEDILSSHHISIEDFNIRMFPLFNAPIEDEQIKNDTAKKVEISWPHVYNIDPLKKINELKLPLPHYLRQSSSHEYNMNVWKNWLNASVGKGIVTTLQKEDVPMFRKLVTVLMKHNNILPTQIVTTRAEMNK
ncbi:hypothetical protein MOUN0_C02630 [Monosporozyma unispora]